MTRFLIITGFFLLTISSVNATETTTLNTAEQQALESQLVAHYRDTVKKFGGTLLKELQSSLQQDGAISTIAVCNEKAPQIAKILAEENNLSLKRISLKNRNAHNGVLTDSQEATVLQSFVERQAKGEDLSKVEQLTKIEKDGQTYYQFMKAIPTGAVCLTCHGEKVDAVLYDKIKAYYPDDKAIGFKEGELRGAFLITQPVSQVIELYKQGKLPAVTP
ncbi:Tll0287-like domain-containing protein [Beggiatoa leptomitoformis]|uniref:DUF3365 domain-containing protein n=1 Tax=Beggiatoa leptomitoformis TaxID=288004 RepID=A0A2N9YHV8_9GAMM|nr:DUF3365 domain-containing protein [Beggiatoa leptomitoformis]ALG67646.1 DUF3365 domain-containing protein [Beggiatoa leptomitoformis]AUI70118.1 DUF3365 domain-containing protein [Beggiatoa leptomitoformis]